MTIQSIAKQKLHSHVLFDSERQSLAPRSGRSNSPFRYPGGKFYARRLILDLIPEHTYYFEPFAGGASIFFAKSKAKFNTLNDLDGEVINTFTQIRDHVDELIHLLEGIPATKQLHHFYKNIFTPSNELEQAFRWFYLNRTSYSGIMRAENCYWGFGEKYSMRPENWPPHLRTVSDKLQNVSLSSHDFETIIDSSPSGSFMFIDPPYYNADQHKFYNCIFTKEDHERLASCLRRHVKRISFLLTYDDDPEIRKMYKWIEHIEGKQWNYTINRTDDQKNKAQKKDGFKRNRYRGQEIFIRNYQVQGDKQ